LGGVWETAINEIAGDQHNRIALTEIHDLGIPTSTVHRWVTADRLVQVHDGVFAVAPLLNDPWGRWMGATLTAPDTFLSRVSASVAWEVLGYEEELTVVRPGSGGPRRHEGILVHRSSTLEGNTTELNGVPITTIERTLLDIAPIVSEKALRRAVRVAVREEHTSLAAIGDAIGRAHGPRGAKRVAAALARYAGLPIERARSGAEIRAIEILRDYGRPLPQLNIRIAGEEADLVWRRHRQIIEIDGGPWHLDAGEDARKQAAWEQAGYEVRRIPSDDVYEHPPRLLALAPAGDE
jgi:hypothetical protein